MTILVRDRTKISIFLLFLVFTSLNVSLGIEKCNATYKETSVTSMYEGYLVNDTLVDLEYVASINILQDNYSVIFNHTKPHDDSIDNMLSGLMVCTLESIGKLPRYTIGVKHSSWFPRDAVYNDTGNLLLVYDVITLTLLYMNGQVLVNGNETFAFVIMTSFVLDDDLAEPISFLFWLTGIIAASFIAGLMIYVFFLRKRMEERKQIKSAKKSGRKMDSFKKEIEERKKKVLKKQEKKKEKEEKKKEKSEQ